ncbi:DUF3010 domain-containing protein [Brumimicrobium salinarum]|uniref:DUF3010 domain-containing protein n=1 Tax=Brumimicrobium salinarum TaxID=2058658 RepID=A0A2I0R3M8_9FLAO|nr:DUF3010 family protein [Brumimicrobium salinarum]PKR81172.1 DUF3010 domain-containing protein [Brumimicrobium salinarum]
MKALGISIEGSTAIFSGLEKSAEGIFEVSDKLKKVKLKDHLDDKEVQSVYEIIHAYLDRNNFDVIAIIKRGTKGTFAASPISFKIEGLIQMYKDIEVDFVAPPTLRAYFKKNENTFTPQFAYQKAANDLAFYMLEISND